jgi:hypothetical protein
VSALAITQSVASARPERIGSIERRMTSRGTSGRTASWMRTMSSSAAARLARPLRVLSLRVIPPATIEIGTPCSSVPTSSSVSASQLGWLTTTIRSTPPDAIARIARDRIGSPASRTNCLGISAPNRSPEPPARTRAWIRTGRG